MKKSRIEYIVGIDEVGRGPIAGPVAVGVFLASTENLPMLRRIFKGVKESKQLTPKAREEWMNKIMESASSGRKLCVYKVTMVSAKIIDKQGITYSINKALVKSLNDVLSRAQPTGPDRIQILLDGGLRAPKIFTNQKTIIKGDEKEVFIALASIAAKVTRDHYMIRLTRKYPDYGFGVHKGYGTKAHYKLIKKLGIISEHRKSFL